MAATPRKRFGQHFLHDPGVVDRILGAVSPRRGERLVEIGPGEGVLTGPLLHAAGALDAIELDRDLAAALRARTDWPGELTIHEGDVLRFDFRALATDTPIRVVGNLPYNISTPLLFHLLDQRDVVRDMHFMLQREVVDRLAAAPGSKTYGRLSVMVQAYCRVEALFRVAPGAFRPPPAVDSAVVRLTPLPEPAVGSGDAAAFAEVVRLAFAQRRKTLRNALRTRVAAERVRAAGIDPTRRAETLSVVEYARLAAAAGASADGER